MNKQPDSIHVDPKLDACGQKQKAVLPLRWGAECPRCGKGKLDYNGLLELECPECHFRDTSTASYT